MKRRTLWDALHDKLIDLVDSYDIAGILDAPKKKPLTITVKELSPSDESQTPKP